MTSSKPTPSDTLIPTATFGVCLLDQLTLDQICALYTRADVFPGRKSPVAYRLSKLVHHLKVVHQMTLEDYCRRFGICDWPRCPIKGGDVGYRVSGQGIHLSRLNKGAIDTSSAANQAQYARMREVRRGAGNPMHGKQSWNKGLGLEDPRVAASAAKRRGKPHSPETIQRLTEARRASPHQARHTTPHSETTKEQCRLATARRWAEGAFKRTSSIHLKMRAFLQTLALKEPFVEEHQVKWFSMDFAFPSRKVAIEVQGSYYHVDPRLYPDGPIDAIQRRNWGRDKAKRITCCDREGWVIIEAWEPEINDDTFKDDITCKLKRYALLD